MRWVSAVGVHGFLGLCIACGAPGDGPEADPIITSAAPLSNPELSRLGAGPDLGSQAATLLQITQHQVADVDGDGRADFLVHGTANRISAYRTGVTGGLALAGSIQHGGQYEAGRVQYADVTGDKRTDLIYQGTCSASDATSGINNCFYVSPGLASGSFGPPALWGKHGGPFDAGRAQYADVNGDQRADLVYQGGCSAVDAAVGTNNCFYVSIATTGSFAPPALWARHGGAFEPGRAQYADVTGDGRSDLSFEGGCDAASATAGQNDCFYVSPALTAGGFAPATLWIRHGGNYEAGRAQYADVSGDGRADLIVQGGCAPTESAQNCFYVARSKAGGGFEAAALWVKHGGTFERGRAQYADVNGDKRTDLVYQGGCDAQQEAARIANCFYVSTSSGSTFAPPRLGAQIRGSFVPGQAKYADLSADGRADLVFFGADRQVYTALSNGSAFNAFKVSLGDVFAAAFARPAPAVIVMPPASAGSAGRVVLPNGSSLPIPGSTTGGLQEAITYAADFGWDMFVYGGSYPYTLSSPLRFPALQGRTFRFMNTVLSFGPTVTNAAIEIDSTMMVDLEITGEVRAPSASTAVWARPQGLHPLDGAIHHLTSPGITDSRFRFGKLSARPGAAPATIDTQRGSVLNSLFYVQDYAATAYPAAWVGQGLSFETEAEHQRTVLALPNRLDPMNPRGVVVHPPSGPIGDPGRVFLPNGLELDVRKSVSAGLQEAIDVAAMNSLDLMVYGRGLQNAYISASGYPTNGFYQLRGGVVVPQMTDQVLRVFNATLNHVGGGHSAWRFLGAKNSLVELTGQIVASGGFDAALRLDSREDPATNARRGTGFEGSVFLIGSPVIGSGLPGGSAGDRTSKCVVLDPSLPMRNNRFYLSEINGGAYGISIPNAGPAGGYSGNFILWNHLHDQSVAVFQFGSLIGPTLQMSGSRIVSIP